MEAMQPEAVTASGGIVAPKSRPAPAFAASPSERRAALASYALGYLYIRMFDAPDFSRVLLAAFTPGFVALTEYLHRETPRAKESWIWLGCTATVCSAVVCGRGNAWSEGLPLLFLHIFAVWWALCRSGALLEGESGHLLPLDALDGFVSFPFTHLFHRARTTAAVLSRPRAARRRADSETVIWSVVMSAAALGLLSLAAGLLTSADDGFAALFDVLSERLWRWAPDLDASAILLRILLSLPVGAYLFGLLDGALRQDKAALRERSRRVAEQMELLRGVPGRVWLALLSLFCLLYLAFFAVQSRYLFGAFTRTLPDGFIVSEYARRGFFELCQVMAVNFALLWLATRSSKVDVRKQPAVRALCLVLLAESFLLAVVAFSKLALYISCFGFTPKRLQSTWLVCVLAFGTGCAAWSLTRGGKVFRVWMVFGAVTLSLLCLY